LEDASPDDENGPADNSDVPFLEVQAHHHEFLNPSSLLDPVLVYVPNFQMILVVLQQRLPLKTHWLSW
jgi:hypothetical protein